MIQLKLPVIPHDKALHFIYGAIVALVVLHALSVFGVTRDASKALGLAAAIVIGVAKEYIYDRRMNKIAADGGQPEAHTVSRGDAVATAIGGLAIWLA
jgi:hypothetical protein